MEPELFEELISVIDYFWHRYAGLPFTSKYSIPVRTSYFKQSDSVLSALLRFCIAANFLRLHNYTLQDLIKHRFALELSVEILNSRHFLLRFTSPCVYFHRSSVII